MFFFDFVIWLVKAYCPILLISYTRQHALHLHWCDEPLISSTQDENCGNKPGRNQSLLNFVSLDIFI